MRIASPIQLAARLDRNLAWRKKELTQLKLLADGESPPNCDMLRRSGITLMYAHWEGFVKDASNLYLAYLSRNPLDVGTLRSCFVAIVLGRDIAKAGITKKKSSHSQLVELVRTLETPPPMLRRLPAKGAISTRSNLKAEVLREITATLGIDYSPFQLKDKVVIDRLVHSRNAIAHGGGLPVPKADYDDLHQEIIKLMDAYKDLIQDAADNDRHLK